MSGHNIGPATTPEPILPPEHTGSMENDPTGLHPVDAVYRPDTTDRASRKPGPLAELDGELGSAARQLVAALNPHPAQLAATEQIVSEIAKRIGDAESVIALRYVVETAVTRASAAPLMPPRGDQQGERVTGRPDLTIAFCGFHSLHPSHVFSAQPGHVARCLGMDASGVRGPQQ